MGYYTTFVFVDVQGANADKFFDDFHDGLVSLRSVDTLDLYFEDLFTPCTHKWYEFSEDFAWMSSRYPDTTFIINGTGEEPGDLWRAYGKNGEMQMVKGRVVYDEMKLNLGQNPRFIPENQEAVKDKVIEDIPEEDI